jgi:tRNA(Ile)-lysidine synthase
MASAEAAGRYGPVDDHELDGLFASLLGAPHVLVAVSGGPDSVAALHLLWRWQMAAGRTTKLSVATVDHGLRGAQSAREASDVAALCEILGLPHATLVWHGEKPATGIAEAARTARYDLLVAHAARINANHLVTGHTLDDQAETLLIRMSRGSGLTGLAAMRLARQRGGLTHLRPFLTLPKERLVATCNAAGLAFVIDPSNANRVHARPRWREIMPLLAAEGLDSRRLGVLASRLARADGALSRCANSAFEACCMQKSADLLVLDSGFLTQQPAEIALRVLGQALRSMALAVEEATPAARLERLESCLEALIVASLAGQGVKRTLQGCTLRLTRNGQLHLAQAPVRHRGVNENQSPSRASLGKAVVGA